MKSIWKSKSFWGGLVSIATVVTAAVGVPVPTEVFEGLFGFIGLILVGKSANKRMKKD